jgi:hypothetical protein
VIAFLYNPALGLGSPSTWLCGDPSGSGFWRTTDSGTTWTQVSTFNPVHGGAYHVFYAADGTIYTGSTPIPICSKDNGLTWAQVSPTGLPQFYYHSVVGDGNVLYTKPDNPGPSITGPFLVTSEGTGTTSAWSNYQGGAQSFINGPNDLVYDSVNGLVYACCWNAGLFVLRVIAP